MTGKDILTLLLVIYGFKDIKIKTYRGVGNAQGYNIEAYHKERDYYYIEENCEGLLFNITHLLNEMKDNKFEPTYNPFPGYEYTTKQILKLVNNK
jgi:hypothetical protein